MRSPVARCRAFWANKRSMHLYGWVCISLLFCILAFANWGLLAQAMARTGQASARQELVYTAVVCIAFSVCLWVILKAMLAPLQKMSEHLNGVAGHHLHPIAGDRPKELLHLVQIFNRLAKSQQESTDLEKRFLANASHQLRTPFAVLRTQVQGMMSASLDAKATLPKMLHTIDRSSELIRQLLSMAKVEQLARRANWTEVNLSTVARDVVMEFGPLIARKKIDFSFQPADVTLLSDAWVLGELVRNLMSNALAHSPKGAAMGLVIRAYPDGAEMLVWDNGGGIDETLKDRLFEPFQSASGANGIGLGLSICRQIAISVEADIALFNRVQDNRTVGVDAVVRWIDPSRTNAPHASLLASITSRDLSRFNPISSYATF